MSFVTSNEEAALLETVAWEASFGSWRSRADQPHYQPSFLSRNARAGLLNMGTSIRALGGSHRRKLQDQDIHASDEEEDDLNFAKRRRLSNPSQAGISGTDSVTQEMRTVSLQSRSNTGAIDAVDFYGTANNATIPARRFRRINDVLNMFQATANQAEPTRSRAAAKPTKPLTTSTNVANMPENSRKSSEIPESTSSNPGEGRPRRNRIEKNLNLRAMSRISLRPHLQHSLSASPEKGANRRASHLTSRDPNQWKVTYTLGDFNPLPSESKRKIEVAGLTCALCQATYQTVDNLRHHLCSSHPRFIFKARRLSPPELSFFVILKVAPPGSPRGSDQPKAIIQLRRPTSLLDVEACLEGDHSWAKAREGPEHVSDYNNSPPFETSLSTSTGASRHSSPNTSIHTNDLMDIDEKPSMPKRKTCRVPKTDMPLYDMVTKRVLRPGEVIPDSDDEKDEGWLRQKMRDTVHESNDLTAAEEDYIFEWNPFALDKQLAVDTFLPEVVLEFVTTRKKWFLGEKSRKRQFFKHVQILQLRGALSQKHFHKYVTTLREAENEAEQHQNEQIMNVDQPAKPVIPYQLRGLLDCECCEQTQPPDRVTCQGYQCPGRFFHRKCAESQGREVARAWKCNNCL